MSLVAVGACYLDTILTTSHFPGEDEKLRASNVTRRRGGNCPNTLEVLQQLVGHQLTKKELSFNLIAVLPAKDSVASQQIRSAFEPRVRLDHSIYREQFEEPASSYIIKSQSTGSRTIVNYNELPEMTVEEFTRIADELGPEATWFHFEGRIPDVTLGCIQYLRKQFPSIRVSVEVEKPGRPGLEELANVADVVFYSKSWAQSNGYQSAMGLLRKQAEKLPKSILCCTWGGSGAAIYEGSSGYFGTTDAHTESNSPVVDTIGAGDTFIAGMLYALNCPEPEWKPDTKLIFANRIAGTKVLQEGFSGLDRVMEAQ